MLADKLAVSRPTVTATLDWLEQRQMIARMPDPADGRRLRISETSKGAAARKRCDALVAERLVEILGHLDRGAAETVATSLGDLHRALIADRNERHFVRMKSDDLPETDGVDLQHR